MRNIWRTTLKGIAVMGEAQGIVCTTALIDREQANRALVRWWLYGIALLVFAMIIVGGATRLTDSGLSITQWKLIHGIIPPLSHADWMAEFEKYKLIPEYSQVNQGMSLSQFQFIYWWEWAHRFLGRIVGFAFLVPLAIFWAGGRLDARLKPRLTALLALGGLQGFVGWWMVSSGLSERVDVSQYRLAVHLTLACLIFAWCLWIARGLAPHASSGSPLRLRILAPVLVAAILVQIFLGALVAGLDAGMAFNDWPTMDGTAIPQGLLLLEPAWRNFFENPKTVQFVHRIGGYTLFALALLQWWVSGKIDAGKATKRRAAILFALVAGQAALGILTLVWQAPLNWALAHQAGAAIVLGFAVAHWRALFGGNAPRTSIELRR